MSLREQLHAYIARLEERLRWNTWLRGLAIFAGSALLATLVLVSIDLPDILYQFDREYSEGMERDGGVGQGPAFEALAPHQR